MDNKVSMLHIKTTNIFKENKKTFACTVFDVVKTYKHIYL